MYEMPYHASLICTIFTEVGKIYIDTSKKQFFFWCGNCPCCGSNIRLFSIAPHCLYCIALFIDIDLIVDRK